MLYKNKFFLPQLLEFLIVSLMFIHAIVSNTIFDSFQIFIEIFLLILGSYVVLKYIKLDNDSLKLLWIFTIVQIVSFFQNPILIFLLNFKVFSLGILFLIIFKNFRLRSYLFNLIGSLSIALILLELFVFSSSPLPVDAFIINQGFMNSKPISFFLNYHFAAFFTAVYLIGKSYRYNFLGMDYLFIYMLGVKTTLFSYFVQQLLFKKNIKFFERLSFGKEMFILFLCAILVIAFIGDINELMQQYSVKYRSFYVIIRQLLSWDFILSMIYLFPTDYTTATINANNISYLELGIKVVSNELAFLTYIVQGGVFMFAYYMYVLLKSLSIFRVFILLSLIHYSFILSPLCIAFMFESQHRYIKSIHNKNSMSFFEYIYSKFIRNSI